MNRETAFSGSVRFLAGMASQSLSPQDYPSSQLFGEDIIPKAMVLGDVQMAAPALPGFSRDSDVSALHDFPFLLRDRGVFAAAES